MRHIITSLLLTGILITAGCSRHGGSAATEAAADPAADPIAILDNTVAHHDEYTARKLRTIDTLRAALNDVTDDARRFEAKYRLFQEFHTFSMDTTLTLARELVTTATRMGNDSLIWLSHIMEVEALKGLGEYSAALQLLDRIPQPWKQTFRERILNRYVSIYYSLSEYPPTPEAGERYFNKLDAYRDSVSMFVGRTHVSYWLNNAERQRAHGRFRQALASLDSANRMMPGTVDPGVMAYLSARNHEALGDLTTAKKEYAVAAAYDLRHAVRKYESLQELARILSAEGDNTRAYTYIMCAINDIKASKARSRTARIADYLPIVLATYTQQQENMVHNKNLLLITVTALALALVVSLLFIRRKNLRLDAERRRLHDKNSELERLRQQLSEVNRSLEESAKVKEQSLGTLFNLCSAYIGAMDRYRVQLAQRIKAGKFRDIESLLAAPAGVEHLQSFFRKFDSIFLEIFPDFIEKFNALMQPGHELTPKPGELLSTELRIYALVRLGINDSTQIAAFLHYSPQTVYNYRFRVRSHSRLPKEQFPDAVRAL